MTRDAKIGLLLGLVFIFIIAFIINGLPSFQRGDGNELTHNMANPQRANHGIGKSAERVTNIRPAQSNNRPAAATTAAQPVRSTEESTNVQPQRQKVRFEIELPQSTGESNTTITKSDIASLAEAVRPKPSLVAARQEQETEIIKPKTVAPQRARIYMVQEGDNLASIAKKFYGEELGNKQANVNRIFKANSKILKAPDQIYVGQKLIVPPPSDTSTKNVLEGKDFVAVESIGKHHQVQKTESRINYYKVKEGDSLWKIAAEQLGNGSRYTELAKLNKLSNENFLVVGSRLKLPQ